MKYNFRYNSLPNRRLPKFQIGPFGSTVGNTPKTTKTVCDPVCREVPMTAEEIAAEQQKTAQQQQNSTLNLPQRGFGNTALGQTFGKIGDTFKAVRKRNQIADTLFSTPELNYGDFTKPQIKDMMSGQAPNLDYKQVSKLNSGIPCPEGYTREANGSCQPILATSPEILDKNKGTAQQLDTQFGNSLISNLRPFEFRERKKAKEFVKDYNQEYGTNYKVPFMTQDRKKFMQQTGQLANSIGTTLGAGLSIADNISEAFAGKKQIENFYDNWRDNNFTQASAPGFRGNFNNNTGMFQQNRIFNPNEGLTFEEGGQINNTMKIKITGLPQMAFGGQSSGYGLDLNQRRVQVQGAPSKYDSVSNTLTAVPRNQANIEAEGGETIFGDLDDDGALEHMTIRGNRHTEGGVPLNVPQGSFVFSDTRKMKIKDPEILSRFGVSNFNKSFTPAALAKKYDINKYKAVMEDPNADPLSKATAQMMVKNYQKKLGELADVQEGMKGYPAGQPEVSKKVLGMDQQQYDQAQSEMAYGGYLHKYQVDGTTTEQKLPEFDNNYANLDKLYYSDQNKALRDAVYKSYLERSKGIRDYTPIDERRFHNAMMEHQRQIYGFNFGNDKHKALTTDELNAGDWDANSDNKHYSNWATKFGYVPLSGDEIGAVEIGNQGLADYVLDPNKNPDFHKSFGQYVKYDPFGKADQTTEIAGQKRAVTPYTRVFGNTLNRQIYRMRAGQPETQPAPVEGWICDQGTGKATKMSFPSAEEKAKAGAKDSEAEALQGCGKPVEQGKPVTYFICVSKGRTQAQTFKSAQEAVANGYSATEAEALQKCPGDVPFKALTPDRLNLLGATMLPPQIYMPYSPDLTYNPRQLALEDWQAQAQNIQQNYNSSANTLGNFQPGQSLASNLSYMAGQAANNIGQAIAGTTGRNVDRYNDYASSEQDRKDRVDQYNALNHRDLYDKSVIARQSYRNAWRQHLANINSAHTGLWDNRMKMYMTNMSNPNFYVDPRTGKTVWRNNGRTGADVIRGGGSGSPQSYDEMQSDYAEMKKRFSTMTEKDYLDYIKSRRSYTDVDGDGYPDRSTRTMYGPGNYNFRYHGGTGADFSGITGMDPYTQYLMAQQMRGR